MQEERWKPPFEFTKRLNDATLRVGDIVLYCKCGWIGETNAAHARTSRCPECAQPTRIWKHEA